MFDDLKKSLLSLVGGKSLTMRKYLGEATDDWDESKHPRGNPGNAGQFAKKGQQTQSGSENQSGKGGEKESSSGSSTSSNIHSYVTPEEDAAYKSVTDRIVAATKSGKQPDAKDLEEASRMVRDAAAKAMPNTCVKVDGKPIVIVHTTNAEFNSFRPSTIGWFGGGVYFSVHGGYDYGRRKMNVFLNAKNLATMDDVDQLNDERGKPDASVNVEKFGRYRSALEKRGYDGFISPEHGTTIAYWGDVSNIKSADPVTYDDAGNVVPLSKRFDSGNDIRGAV